MEFKTKKDLKEVVTEVYDRALLEGKVEFSDRYPDLEGIAIEAKSSTLGIYHVNLDFKSGYLGIGVRNGMTRKQIIRTFTEFLWVLINS